MAKSSLLYCYHIKNNYPAIALLKRLLKEDTELIWQPSLGSNVSFSSLVHFMFSHHVHQNTTFCSTEVILRRWSTLIQLYFAFILGPCFFFPVIKVALIDPIKIMSCGFMISCAVILQQRITRPSYFSTEHKLNFDPTLNRKSSIIIPMWLLLLASSMQSKFLWKTDWNIFVIFRTSLNSPQSLTQSQYIPFSFFFCWLVFSHFPQILSPASWHLVKQQKWLLITQLTIPTIHRTELQKIFQTGKKLNLVT